MAMYPCCEKCVLDSYLNQFPQDADPNHIEQYQDFVRNRVKTHGIEYTGAEAATDIKEYRKQFGWKIEKDYSGIKSHYNDLMLGVEDRLWQEILAAGDSTAMAVQYAMMGNFIDFSALADVREEKLLALLAGAKKDPIAPEILEEFKDRTGRCKSLCYATDNCGEIVTDKLLIREIQRRNPGIQVTVIVKGEQVVNDATMEDAVQVGLPELCRVMHNGSGADGTDLPRITREAREALFDAEIVIAKGQANYETLMNRGLPVYYILMAKCEFFMDRFGVPRFTGILTREA